MNKKNNFLFLLCCLSLNNINLAMNNNNRYKTIVAAFNPETNSFDNSFISNDSDIAIVKEHKEQLKTTLAEQYKVYTNSWTPSLLKILGAGFILESVLMGLRSISAISDSFEAPKTKSYGYGLRGIADRILAPLLLPVPKGPESLSDYTQLALSRILYPIDSLIIEPLDVLASKARQMYYQKSITRKTYLLTGGAVTDVTALATQDFPRIYSIKLLDQKMKLKN